MDRFMAEAIREAEISLAQGGIPTRAVPVGDGEITGRYACTVMTGRFIEGHPGLWHEGRGGL